MRKKLYLLSATVFCFVLAFGASGARERARQELASAKHGLTRLDGRAGSGINGPAQTTQVLPLDRTDVSRKDVVTGDLQKATTLLRMATKSSRSTETLTLLRRALELNLPETPAGQRVLTNLHYRLAGLYQHDRKKAHHLAAASRHAGTEAQRLRLAHQAAALGLDRLNEQELVDVVQTTGPAAAPGIELADTCDAARSAGTFSGAGERFTATAFDVGRGGKREWFTLTVGASEPGTGLALRAVTFSDEPGGSSDDSILELWTGCTAGNHRGLIGFADDQGGNAPFMSTLETTCLAPGNYYLSVGAFDETVQADNIDLQIEAVTVCAVPVPDAFEPDNNREEATRIVSRAAAAAHGSPGTPTSQPPQWLPAQLPPAHSRGHGISEVQEHSVYPEGDEDWVRFGLKRDSFVRIRTACGFPSASNDFTECENPPEFDTILEVYYASETTTGGLCNQTARPEDPPGFIDGRSSNACISDLDCDKDGDGLVFPEDLDDLQNPFEGLPACLPWTVFSTTPVDPVDNPLAFSDDVSFPANLGGDLTLCLPSTRKQRTNSLSVAADPADDFNWYVRAGGWSPDGEIANSTLAFDYALFVETLGDCAFENEPNNDFVAGDDDDDDDDDDGGPNRLTLGESIHGIWDFSATQPVPDHDIYQFDVTEPTGILFEIDGFDPIAVDTFIELVVGPDDDGNFFFTGDSNDDVSASDLRSRLELFLPPACEMLGNCIPGAEGPESEAESTYYLNVTSAFVVPNFPYELRTSVQDDVIGELTDFGDCGSGDEAPFGLGQRYLSNFDDTCDFDGYKFSLAENAFVRLATGPSGADTVMELRDCNTDELLACDDDSGPGFLSAMEGCLPGGHDYCVRVRAWDGSNTFAYSIEASGGESCDAEDPPAIDAEGSALCDAFDACP